MHAYTYALMHMHACMHARTHASMHTCTHTHTHTHIRQGDMHGCEKNGLEIVIEQVRLESSLKRGGTIRVVEWLRQIALN